MFTVTLLFSRATIYGVLKFKLHIDHAYSYTIVFRDTGRNIWGQKGHTGHHSNITPPPLRLEC